MKNDWIEVDNTLQKTFALSDFKEALAFTNMVGEIAERLQHHPDICIKDFNKVSIATSTHEEGNIITTKDRDLVDAIDNLNIS
ncbi:hypothetical protein A3G63_00530 [Candidatus Kaiserbacteria bacterium RIFCSPLOWO2_12_FULL_52_8]|uniref:4a-hydroxytetrahydrobiopterin dehydratase n=1 Tax=Candidatus Kaiserbacteria bacterium RIFCSPHIGHO2_01_FULL_53_31 TaxID=1798481 RepID=A0A1F6CJC8_9BACT|nr:MAG: hypothetical protein A2678_01180 [Candidatus Kaiserbacteria bacterium RIFCSPHIGHO2_01_FULL_53_31]OGG92648.1 MAG: hypothetical protein A3G63_00530 [Candidatus Kaiserbacteria bacterium RIFCSPLOWO2_12_FULL_52_8]